MVLAKPLVVCCLAPKWVIELEVVLYQRIAYEVTSNEAVLDRISIVVVGDGTSGIVESVSCLASDRRQYRLPEIIRHGDVR